MKKKKLNHRRNDLMTGLAQNRKKKSSNEKKSQKISKNCDEDKGRAIKRTSGY